MGTPLANQIIAVSAICLNSFAQSMFFVLTTLFILMSSSATAVELLQIRNFGHMMGLIVSSVTMHRYGRRLSHLMFIAPGFLYWTLVVLPNNAAALESGIFFGGFSAGGTMNLGAIMIGEYSNPSYRGVFLYLNNCFYMISGMFTVIMIFNINHKLICVVGAVSHILSAIVMFKCPETPIWLAWNGQLERSEQAFKWLRENTVKSSKEYSDLIKAQTAQDAEEQLNFFQQTVKSFKKLFKREFLKPSGLIILAMILVDMSGKHFFSVCAEDIMSGFSRDPDVYRYNYHLLVTLIMVGTSALATFLVKMMKQRTLLFSSGFSAWGLLTLLSFFSIVLSTDKPETTITFFALYFILAQLSCAPLQMVMIGEIFPYSYKSFGSLTAGFSDIFVKFCVHLATPLMLDRIKVHYTLFIYSLLMGVCLFILFYELPETKGATLLEIENSFKEQKFGSVVCMEHREHENDVVATFDCPYCSEHFI